VTNRVTEQNQPLQVWLPTLGQSLNFPEVRRDAQRAFQEWRGEPVVWLLPEIVRPVRWRLSGIWNLAVPAEGFDRIDVVHVSERGRIYAPGVVGRTPTKIDGLLESWLNLQKAGGITLVYPPKELTIPAPKIESEDVVSFQARTIEIGPGTYIPFDSVDKEKSQVTMKWPPGGSPAPISPDAESASRFPSTKINSDPPTVVTAEGHAALHLLCRWPNVLDNIMSVLSGTDDLLAQARMAQLARQSQTDQAQALRESEIAGQEYLFDGHTSVEHFWLRPAIAERGVRHILFKAEERGLLIPKGLRRDQAKWDLKLLNQLLERDEWRAWLTEPVSIRRAWGGVGLFWWLLIDQLKQHRSFASCESCGRVIPGKDGKRFCGSGDDPICFKSRRANDQRRSRVSRASARSD
jgi:hypothetical protein